MSVTLPPITEAEFLRQVGQLATLCGWRWHHARPARTKTGWRTAIQGHKGFPDLVLVRARDSKFMLAELKVGRNKLTPEQRDWLADCEAARIVAYVWRPEDWPAIDELLK